MKNKKILQNKNIFQQKKFSKTEIFLKDQIGMAENIEYLMTKLEISDKQPSKIEYDPIIIKRIAKDKFAYSYSFKQKTHHYLHPIYTKNYSFGADFIEYDHAARLVQSRIDPAKDWALLTPGMQDIAESFVAGINLRVNELKAVPAELPPEFQLFNLQPL